MNLLKRTIASAFFLGFLSVTTSFATTQMSGQDDRVEWKKVNELQLSDRAVDAVYSLDGSYVFILTPKNNVLIYDRTGKLQGKVPVDKGVSAIDVTPYGDYLRLIDSESNVISTLSISFVVDINTSNAPFKGKMDAPVTIAVFSDFE